MATFTTPKSDAAAYAATIAAELESWYQALAGDPAALAEIVREIGHAPTSWYDYIDAVALEVQFFHNHATGATITEVVRTCGGPSCRIIRDSRDVAHVTVSAYWWGDAHAEVRFESADLAEVIDTLADANLAETEAGR